MTLKSATITEDRFAPVHPGEVLLEDFMKPLRLSAQGLAEKIGVPGNRVSSIVGGKRAITGDTALRLAGEFGTTPEFWMNLQRDWELDFALLLRANKASSDSPTKQET